MRSCTDDLRPAGTVVFNFLNCHFLKMNYTNTSLWKPFLLQIEEVAIIILLSNWDRNSPPILERKMAE